MSEHYSLLVLITSITISSDILGPVLGIDVHRKQILVREMSDYSP